MKELKRIKNKTEYKVDYIYQYISGKVTYILLCTSVDKDKIGAKILTYDGDDCYADMFIKKGVIVFWLENTFIPPNDNTYIAYELGDKMSLPEYFL